MDSRPTPMRVCTCPILTSKGLRDCGDPVIAGGDQSTVLIQLREHLMEEKPVMVGERTAQRLRDA